MSWLLNLYQTYESNLDLVGKPEKKQNDQEYTLLPICHTTQNAHIEVTVTEDGEFHSAEVIDKNEASTLIPCTEDSANRAGSKIAPYPLHDKLSYVAGDYTAYGGEIKKEEPFAYYIKQLQAWAESPHATREVKSIYGYLKKGQLIRDLVANNVLFVDADQRLLDKWDKTSEAKPPIFSVIAGDQTSAFVRFTVRSTGSKFTKVWEDPDIYDSFIRFYSERLGDTDVCYVTGQRLPSTDKHANKIRNAADKAKLISANDTSGFTFRGRFTESGEAANISYDVSQKAHNALKWLIHRQAKIIDNRVFLVWGNDDLNLPDPNEDYFSLDPTPATPQKISYTNQDFAAEVAKALDGYRNKLSTLNQTDISVNIMVLDSATTGRMAVLYYRNIDKHLYLDRLAKWHSSCYWLHQYRKNDQGEYVSFFGAPATRDIAFAAYGPRADDKIVKGLMERMFPCIVEERDIPKDIVSNAFRRASNPEAMDRWEWEKTLSIACALINRKEMKSVALDQECNDRDYLFGRMLAVADVLERRALGDERRATNAIRYMNSFSMRPARTWATIQQCLQPYQAKLGTDATFYSKIIDDIGSRLPIEEFTNKPLTGLYLLGFYSQRHEIYQGKKKSNGASEEATSVEER